MLSTVQKRLISYIGKTQPSHITKAGWQHKVTEFCEDFEQKNKDVKLAEIKGSQPHKSRDDPSDPLDVISVRFFDANGKRVASAHIHEDGSSKVLRW